MAILENVKEIFDGEDQDTEGDWIIKQLSDLGYVVTVILSQAHILGSLATRIRAYFLCIRLPREIANDYARQVHVRQQTPDFCFEIHHLNIPQTINMPTNLISIVFTTTAFK